MINNYFATERRSDELNLQHQLFAHFAFVFVSLVDLTIYHGSCHRLKYCRTEVSLVAWWNKNFGALKWLTVDVMKWVCACG